MRFACHATTLAACLGVALAPIASFPARADSAVGADAEFASATTLGLIRGWGIALDPDEEPKRSPSGILYNRTPPPPEPRARTASGWETSGVVEAGGSESFGDTSSYFFQRYKDVGNGGYLRYFDSRPSRKRRRASSRATAAKSAAPTSITASRSAAITRGRSMRFSTRSRPSTRRRTDRCGTGSAATTPRSTR